MSVPVFGLYAIDSVAGARNFLGGSLSPAPSGLSTHSPGWSTVTGWGKNVLPPSIDFWNRSPASCVVLHSSSTYEISRSPFFSTTGTENWSADSPTRPLPGLSGTTWLYWNVVSAGLVV